MGQTITLKGFHATTRTAAESIHVNGFEVGAGRLGTGAYFWRYDTDPTIAKTLGTHWYLYQKNKQSSPYEGQPDQRGVLLHYKLTVEQNEFASFEGPRAQESLQKYAQKLQGIGNPYDLAVQDLATYWSAKGVTLKAYGASTALPPGAKRLPSYTWMHGAPVFVVLKEGLQHLEICDTINL